MFAGVQCSFFPDLLLIGVIAVERAHKPIVLEHLIAGLVAVNLVKELNPMADQQRSLHPLFPRFRPESFLWFHKLIHVFGFPGGQYRPFQFLRPLYFMDFAKRIHHFLCSAY
jgi:hypothetical protein